MSITQYVNGKTRTGSFAPIGGGFIENTATVDPKVYVGPMVSVIDKAHVYFGSRLKGQALIAGNAIIGDPTDSNYITQADYNRGLSLILIQDHANIKDKALIKNQAHDKNHPTTIAGYAVVKDQAQVLAGIVTDIGVVWSTGKLLHNIKLDFYQSRPDNVETLGSNG